MKFENIENSKIYKLYRQDQLNRLTRRIQEIKQRKNQYLDNKNKFTLPFIGVGSGVSPERKRQIQKENCRLQQKIKKAKQSHSQYFFKKSPNLKLSKISNNICLTNRNDNIKLFENLLRSERKTELNKKNYTEISEIEPKVSQHSEQKKQKNNQKEIDKGSNNFLTQILKIYEQTLSSNKLKRV